MGPKPIGKRLCVVHGKNKPHICRTISAEDIHSYSPIDAPRECVQCGGCCAASITLDPEKDNREAVCKEILKKGKTLRSVGVDPERVVEHIRRTGRIPMRMEIQAPEVGELGVRHCVLLVPEGAIKKKR
jgi:hypothetical protein